MDIYIDNLDYKLGEPEIQKLFEVFGDVLNVTLGSNKDLQTGTNHAYVQMPDAIAAERAIDELNGRMLAGKELEVYVSEGKKAEKTPSVQPEKTHPEFTVPPKETEPPVKSNKYSKTVAENGFISIKFGD